MKRKLKDRPVGSAVSTPAPFDEFAAALCATAEPQRLVALSSSVFGEGVTTMAIGLASALTLLQPEPVLLVDANWPDASLSSAFGQAGAPGLAQCLAGSVRLSEAVLHGAQPTLRFLPSGATATELPQLGVLPRVLDDARSRFRFVVVDLPPIVQYPGFVLPWLNVVDQLFIVVRSGATPLSLLRKTVSTVEPHLTPAFVLNAVPPTADIRRIAV